MHVCEQKIYLRCANDIKLFSRDRFVCDSGQFSFFALDYCDVCANVCVCMHVNNISEMEFAL